VQLGLNLSATEATLVETLKLRQTQQSSEVDRLLESYISRARILPMPAYRIRTLR